MRVPEEEPLLGVAEHKQYLTIVGKLMFLTGERPDIQFCVNECARRVEKSSARDTRRYQQVPHVYSRLVVETGTLECK